MRSPSRILSVSTGLLLVAVAACNRAPSAPTGQTNPPTAGVVAATTTSAKDAGTAGRLDALHFDFDKSLIRPAEAALLDQTARWLKARPSVMVQISGHGDERGTDAYNLALGERRAQSVRKALAARGVESRRLTTVTYGESRPLCAEHTEQCWAENRRAEFVVKGQ
jgi:peptidoglycan-associated lipoprotein